MLLHRLILVTALAALIAAPISAAQKKAAPKAKAKVAATKTKAAPKPRVLTALDYFEIQQLMYRYGQTIDTCSSSGYDYADLYTPDGAFIDKFSPDAFAKGGVVMAQGREKLAEVVGGGAGGCKKPADGGLSTKTNGGSVAWNGWTHIMADPVITATATGAAGRVYLLMLGEAGANVVTRDGGYEDVYVKTAKGWRIKQRTHVRTRAWHDPSLQTADLQ